MSRTDPDKADSAQGDPGGRDPGEGLSAPQFAALAAFRYELRRFLAFSEAAAAEVGLPAQQHQALLTLMGHGGAPSVGLLAEQLMIAPHTAAELVSRMVEAGLIEKTPSAQDRRRMELKATPKAEGLMHRLTTAHLKEIGTLEPALARALGRLSRSRPERP
jgi:DNA-binding MarR family transcriptional regulator